MATDEFAPAKVNLTLHVTGQRADGYHLLDSLVAFVDAGDRVALAAGPGNVGLALQVTGPQAAGVPTGDHNLVLRAARMMGAQHGRFMLEKHLPPASGIGGGSADAAATLRLLARHGGQGLPPLADQARLGADVPVCIAGRPCRMSGIGEVLAPVPPLPPVWVVLANPGLALPTPAVFAALARRDNAPMPAALPRWRSAAEFAAWLRMMRNDLEAPARGLAPQIGQVVSALTGSHGCMMARMSGSGATCFGLFADPLAAAAARTRLAQAEPGWWVCAAAVTPLS